MPLGLLNIKYLKQRNYPYVDGIKQIDIYIKTYGGDVSKIKKRKFLIFIVFALKIEL